MQDVQAKLIDIRPLQQGYQVITLEAPEIAREAVPGQFVHVKIPSIEFSRLRRPFSIYDANPETGHLFVLYKTVGYGTEHLSQLPVGSTLTVLGPIGRGFPLNPAGKPYLVGGGYGVAPLWFLASRLPQKGVLFVGGRTAADILEVERFREAGWEVQVATQDGSLGTQGLVTVPLDAALAADSNAELYACGPDGMLHAVGDRAIAHNIKGWLSLDKHMMCGVGACLGCVQKVREGDAEKLVRVCVDGPVFESRDIVW